MNMAHHLHDVHGSFAGVEMDQYLEAMRPIICSDVLRKDLDSKAPGLRFQAYHQVIEHAKVIVVGSTESSLSKSLVSSCD